MDPRWADPGSPPQAAVRKLQKDQKLPETGIADGQTQIGMSQALKVKDDMKRFLDGFDAQMRQAFQFPRPGI